LFFIIGYFELFPFTVSMSVYSNGVLKYLYLKLVTLGMTLAL